MMDNETRELDASEREQVAAFFGDQPFPQNRHWLLSVRDLVAARERNNVERPSNYGALIHDLLTTCAWLHGRFAAERYAAYRAGWAEGAQAMRDACAEAEGTKDVWPSVSTLDRLTSEPSR